MDFVKAPTPKPLVPNSPVTPSVMTATMLNKFQFALPLQRQEKLWQIMGLNLSKQTMANWIQYAYRDYLKPLIGLMKKQLLRENIFHADETPVHVLKEDGRMDNIIQSSRLFKAINYCLSHRNELMNYLRDGDCSISNNLAERSIRPFTIGRKNWVFSGSPAGAEASAAAYSLIETCIANKVDTKEYLEYIFTNMSQEESLKDD